MRNDTGSYDEIMRLTSSRRGDSVSAFDFAVDKKKFSADQMKFLEHVFVSFSESVITNLAPMLQARFNVELMSIVSRSYHAYLNSLPETTPMLIFRLEPDVQGFIDIDFGLAFALFERLMGGKGAAPRDASRNFFTDLEKAILQRPLSQLLDSYTSAWKDIKAVKPQLSSFEFNPMAVHIASPSELMVIIPFQTEIASAQGMINVVLPFRYLQNCIPKSSYDEHMLTKVNKAQGGQQNAAGIAVRLNTAKVPVTVCLGRAELLFQELLTIEVGDTIKLDTEIAQPLKIKVRGRTKFLGHPGVKDAKLACKISRVLQEGDDEYDE